MIPLCFLIVLIVQTVYSQWLEGNPPMPVKNSAMAIGYYNDKIYLIGGDVVYAAHAMGLFDPITQQFGMKST